jgi:uncharacterized protein (TIGR03435 family)
MVGRIVVAGLVGVGMAAGQATAPATATPAKAYTFEVVSIRQNNTPIRLMKGPPEIGPTADGYRMINSGMIMPLITAYVPQAGGGAFYGPDQIKGIPDWPERYDIESRISDEDRAEWQKPERQKAMLQSMLQAMLADRCKLAVHREIKEVSIFDLAVAKGGVKFKETDPTAEHPSGFKLPGGGVEVMNFSKDGLVGVSFYGITMAPLVSWLSGGGTPVQDKTGLTGTYDVVLKRVEMGPAPDEAGGASASDPVGTNEWDIKALGLELKPAKGQVETLVIDHMEKPTEN